MNFEVHESVEHELGTFVVGEWAVLARLEEVTAAEMTLQRMFTAEDVDSFLEREGDITQTIETLVGFTPYRD